MYLEYKEAFRRRWRQMAFDHAIKEFCQNYVPNEKCHDELDDVERQLIDLFHDRLMEFGYNVQHDIKPYTQISPAHIMKVNKFLRNWNANN